MNPLIDPAYLTRDLGGKWLNNYGVAPCPICQPQTRKDQNALTITVKEGRLLLHCKKSGCDFRAILTAAGITAGTIEIDRNVIEASVRSRAVQTAKLKARARSLWDNGKPIQGTKGEAYLRRRGITCALPDIMRWLPDTYHFPSSSYCAAIVADVQPTGGVHRTFIGKAGERLTRSNKMMLGPCLGGAVRLSQGAGPLVVCEGIETGLSLLSGLLNERANVWAALSTSGMKGLILPNESGELIIATDGDEAGIEAGERLGSRAVISGWNVRLKPAPDGQDWNDVLRNRGLEP